MLIELVKAQGYGYILRPVSQEDRDYVSESNAYDGSYEVYCQEDYELAEMDLPDEAWYEASSGDLEPNYNSTFEVDEWTFRHWVGGQSD